MSASCLGAVFGRFCCLSNSRKARFSALNRWASRLTRRKTCWNKANIVTFASVEIFLNYDERSIHTGKSDIDVLIYFWHNTRILTYNNMQSVRLLRLIFFANYKSPNEIWQQKSFDSWIHLTNFYVISINLLIEELYNRWNEWITSVSFN